MPDSVQPAEREPWYLRDIRMVADALDIPASVPQHNRTALANTLRNALAAMRPAPVAEGEREPVAWMVTALDPITGLTAEVMTPAGIPTEASPMLYYRRPPDHLFSPPHFRVDALYTLHAPIEREPAASPVPDSDVRALIAEIRDGFSQDELRERTCQTLVQLAAERGQWYGLWRAEIEPQQAEAEGSATENPNEREGE